VPPVHLIGSLLPPASRSSMILGRSGASQMGNVGALRPRPPTIPLRSAACRSSCAYSDTIHSCQAEGANYVAGLAVRPHRTRAPTGCGRYVALSSLYMLGALSSASLLRPPAPAHGQRKSLGGRSRSARYPVLPSNLVGDGRPGEARSRITLDENPSVSGKQSSARRKKITWQTYVRY